MSDGENEKSKLKIDLPVLAEGSLLAARPSDVRELTRSLVSVVERSYTYIAQLLHRIRDERLYKGWGFTSFQSYVREELNFEIRKANYLVGISDVMIRKLNVPIDKLDKIGWTKAKELVSVIDEENKDDLMKDAEVLTVDEVKDKVRVMKRGSDASVLHPIKFIFDKEQIDNIDHALEIAAEVCKKAGKPSENKNHLLDMIALEFARTHASEATDYSLSTYVNAIERRFGCKILVFNDPIAAQMVIELIEEAERKEAQAVDQNQAT